MCLPADGNVRMREDKSFANDLDVQRGIVSSRVALLLRSAEIKPLLSDLLLLATKAAARGCGLPFRRILFGADGGGEWAGREKGGFEARGRVLCILPMGVMGGCPRADGRLGGKGGDFLARGGGELGAGVKTGCAGGGKWVVGVGVGLTGGEKCG